MNKDQERKKIGRIGEDVACRFIVGKGFSIIERNYRKPWGEIDIVAEKDGVVRFVEVKAVSRETGPDISREMSDYSAEEMAHPEKLEKVGRTAQLYMESKKDKREFQLDVVTVYLNVETRKARCALYEQVL